MTYDKTINTRTTTTNVTTRHTDEIDWEGYNWNDPKHVACLCTNAEGKARELAKLIGHLRIIDDALRAGKEVYASTYGGWPRIWQKAISVGMVSAWPYWEPRPCVLATSTLGCDWMDWHSITGAEVR